MSFQINKIPYRLTWSIRHKVMWPDKPIDYIKIPGDISALHYGLEVNNELISIISLFITGQDAQFRKFATITKEHGKGYGTKLLSYIIDNVETMNINRIWCNARLDKIYFYEKFGMRQTKKHFSKGGINYVVMEKII